MSSHHSSRKQRQNSIKRFLRDIRALCVKNVLVGGLCRSNTLSGILCRYYHLCFASIAVASSVLCAPEAQLSDCPKVSRKYSSQLPRARSSGGISVLPDQRCCFECY